MLGLRSWHKDLLVSEAIATCVVIWAYRDLVDAQASQKFLAGMAGTALLWPGLKITGLPNNPSYPVVCLVTAAIYTIVFFASARLSRRLVAVLVSQIGRIINIEWNTTMLTVIFVKTK